MRTYGKLNRLTQGPTSGTNEGGGTKFMASARKVKENIVKVGEHSSGIGLYLFNYKSEYRDIWGYGRQFGVMADEVETVMPEAVFNHPDGYKMVNYAMLGIRRVI